MIPSIPRVLRSRALGAGLLAALLAPQAASAFNHPGVAFDTFDLDRMKANTAVSPWSTGYAVITSDSRASLTYTMQGPFTEVGRESNVNLSQYENDSIAVLYQSIQFYITGNTTYAANAMAILNAWSTTHTVWSGGTPFLAATDMGLNFVIGAEILRYKYSGWNSTATTNCQNYFANMLWPLFGIGPSSSLRGANQGAAQLKCAIAVAVFNNDTTKFAQVLDAWHYDLAGIAAGSLASGQIGDSGRDQGHALGQLGNYLITAETAFKQGIDLHGELSNRLLACSEYFANYNLGNTVAFTSFGPTYGYYTTIGSSGRGLWSWGPLAYELAYGAYVVRKGVSAPYTTTYRNSLTPNADTFLFRKDLAPSTLPPAPAPAVTSTAPPATTSLTQADIGTTGLAGSGSYSSGTWTVSGAGSDIWSTADSFHYAYQTLTGNGTLIAKVTSQTNTHAWAKAGLMIRESLAANSRYVLVAATPGNGVSTQARRATGAGAVTAQTDTNASPLPFWLKIVRDGNFVATYLSPDGATWTPMAREYFNVSATAYIGLAVTSVNTSALGTATFTNVAMDTSGGLFGSGIRQFVNRNSGKVMEASGGGTTDGTNIQQWTNNSALNKLWDVAWLGGSQYRVTGTGSGKAMDVNGNSTADSANIQLWTYNGGNNQRYTFTATTSGYQRVTPVHSGKCVEVGGNSTADGGNVQQYSYVGSNSQQWLPQSP